MSEKQLWLVSGALAKDLRVETFSFLVSADSKAWALGSVLERMTETFPGYVVHTISARDITDDARDFSAGKPIREWMSNGPTPNYQERTMTPGTWMAV